MSLDCGIPDDIIPLTRQMRDKGLRRLLIIAGEAPWSLCQAERLSDMLPGDWLWVGDPHGWPQSCAPAALRTLLGQEFTHAVFDARRGLDAAALAALAGTLRSGSWLVLLAPDWKRWPETPDADSCRWSDTPHAIATPHFISHLQTCVADSAQTVAWQQHQPLILTGVEDYPAWHPAHQGPQQEQAAVLEELSQMERGVAVLTAARGRGKSSLAGMLVNRSPGRCLVSAPAKASVDVLAQFAADRFHFIAPDALVLQNTGEGTDWLIIDEAAAIPAPLLQKMIAPFSRVLLITTVQGYEGTGRGFLLKFCAALPSCLALTLRTPIRWALNDPLEQLIDRIMVFDEPDISDLPQGTPQFSAVCQQEWPKNARQLTDIYRLLSGAHYRTSPLDWRRLLDAPGMHILQAAIGDRCVAALWMVEEGGLSPLLSEQVWAGFRRPRGNLVAQSLAAQGGNPQAATLIGLRISRIAVHPALQRRHLGSELIRLARTMAQAQVDYLSVSFGYTPALGRFWEQSGFQLIRMGSQREASSGCFNAMAMLPLSASGRQLVENERLRLARNRRWLPHLKENLPPQALREVTVRDDDGLNESDWLELAGFAFAHRPLDTALAALCRLLLACELPLTLLRGALEQKRTKTDLCQEFNLNGRKALLQAQRQQARQGLLHLDAGRCGRLQTWVDGLKAKNE